MIKTVQMKAMRLVGDFHPDPRMLGTLTSALQERMSGEETSPDLEFTHSSWAEGEAWLLL